MSTRPRPPAGLDAAGKAFWRSVLAAYDLSQVEAVMLDQACKTVDLLEQVDAALADYGVVSSGSRGQPVPNRLLMVRCELERNLDRRWPVVRYAAGRSLTCSPMRWPLPPGMTCGMPTGRTGTATASRRSCTSKSPSRTSSPL